MKLIQKSDGQSGIVTASAGGTTPNTVLLAPGYYVCCLSMLATSVNGVVIMKDPLLNGAASVNPFGAPSTNYVGFQIGQGEATLICVTGETHRKYEVWSGQNNTQLCWKRVYEDCI